MDVRRLRYFLAVAETLNFTAAAKHLGIAQPSLTSQIKQLELEVGQLMFKRTSRKVELTEAGRVLCREATAVVMQSELLETRMRDLLEGRGAKLDLAVVSEVADLRIARRIRKFFKKNRNIRPTLRFIEAGDSLESDARWDVVIADRSQTAGFTTLALGSKNVFVATPRKHRLADRKEVVPSDLIGEHLLLSSPDGRSVAERLILSQDPSLIERISPQISIESSQERLWKVEAGMGLMICSECDADRSRGTTAIPFASNVAQIHPVVAYRPELVTSAILELIEHLTTGEES